MGERNDRRLWISKELSELLIRKLVSVSKEMTADLKNLEADNKFVDWSRQNVELGMIDKFVSELGALEKVGVLK